ncbi:hypothetical protein, partial [Actinomadura formosensis]|uniref:hypothetical protein n=1 Tax=Actinomadura formosensis TaxID=60706 RepID=UPI001C3F2A3C
GRDGVTRVWSLCGACTIAPALNGTAAAAALLWRPDCLTCRDTGWAHPRVLSPAEAAAAWASWLDMT